MDVLTLLCVLSCLCIKLILGCDINVCMKNNQLMMPQSCHDRPKNEYNAVYKTGGSLIQEVSHAENSREYTTMLHCLKREYDGCTNHGAKAHLMMGMQIAMKSGVYCGYDMNQMTQMMTARTGLMTSLMNGTNGVAPFMMGDDGPFDMDDDDGPFDNWPFDDGPFDDMGGHGMIPFLAASGGTQGKTDKPPQAPGLLPSFGGGSMMQTNDQNDQESGSVQNVQSWSVLTTGLVSIVYLLNGM